MNNGCTVDLTPSHPIQTMNGFMPARDTVGQKLPNLLPNVYSGCDPNCLLKFSGKNEKECGASTPGLIESLGFFQGGGWVVPWGGIFGTSFSVLKDGEFVNSVFQRVFDDLGATVQPDDSQSDPSVSDRSGVLCGGDELSEWLWEIGAPVGYDPERHLPEFVFGIGIKGQAAFLRGLFGANGFVIPDEEWPRMVALVSECQFMLRDVQLVLQSLGIAASVCSNDGEGKVPWEDGEYRTKGSHRLEIGHARDIASFAHQIGFPQTSELANLSKLLWNSMYSEKESAVALQSALTVTKIEHLDVGDDAYVVQTSNGHLSLANGVAVGSLRTTNILSSSRAQGGQ